MWGRGGLKDEMICSAVVSEKAWRKSSGQAPFTFDIVGSILATDSCENALSQVVGFLQRYGFLSQGKLTGWVTTYI
jgi:hypothetical protein